MSWIITNDQYVIRSNHKGCATPTSNTKRAKIFNNLYSAEEYLRSLPKALKNLGYYVLSLDPPAEQPRAAAPEPVIAAAEEKVEVLQTSTDVSELTDPEYYLKSVEAFREFIHTIKTERPSMEQRQLRAEMEVEDLLHAAEFFDLSPKDGHALYLKLHEARVRRRHCKNAVAWMDFVLQANPDTFLRNDPSERIRGSSRRQYRPRALPELFTEK